MAVKRRKNEALARTPGLGGLLDGDALLKRSSFGSGALLLGAQERQDLALYYAYCRAIDDCADEFAPAQARQHLKLWQAELTALHQGRPRSPLAQGLAELLLRRKIPAGLLDDLWQGAWSDARAQVRFKRWHDLHRYCYQVAGSVGLVCLPIFGLDLQSGGRYALALGEALQLINILRDVKEDVAKGRLYFAQEDLRAVGLSDADFMQDRHADGQQRLFAYYAARARAALAVADAEARTLPSAGLRPSRIMRAVYGDLLTMMEADGFQVREKRYRLPWWRKQRAVLSALWMGASQ